MKSPFGPQSVLRTPKGRKWLIASVAVLVVVGLVAGLWSPVSTAVAAKRVELLNDRIARIYTSSYQTKAQKDLVSDRDSKTHDEDSIYTSENPYGTSTSGLYVYFTTKRAAKVTYRVSTTNTDYPDYAATPKGGDSYSTKHEFQAVGLVPGETNTVTLTITYRNGESITRTITQKSSDKLGPEESRLTSTKANSGQNLGNGLYAILGNDSDEQDYLFYYDTHGVLRAEIPILYYRAHRLLFNDGLMYFSASTRYIVGMNSLGRIVKFLYTGDNYILHHDYALDSDGNLVVLATDTRRKTIQDAIIRIDTTTGKVTLLADMAKIYKSYMNSTAFASMSGKATSSSSNSDTTNDKSRHYNADSTPTKKDWLHLNTIQLLPDGSAIVSSRETSTAIKLDNIESDPTIDYMIGEKSFWKNTDYAKYLLTKIGDSYGTGGQHTITYDPDSSLPDGQYYLYMFDNNYGLSNTRPDYDWKAHNADIQTSFTKGTHSKYLKYLVDEKAGTYKLVKSFNVPYSPIVSSVQELSNGTILVDSGTKGIIGVYDTDGNLISQWKMTVIKNIIYRVYQYDFSGFYFA